MREVPVIQHKRLDIDRVAFIGRTYDEYARIFGLDGSLLRRGPILDCPGGASSFAAEARRYGFTVVACDVLYDLPAAELLEKGERDIRLIREKVGEVSHMYVWKYYQDIDALVDMRRKALAQFAGDIASGITCGRYVKASLPRLPFADGSFSLVLSGHFLFLYGDMLGSDFHKACLMELMRVCSGEVRIFPLSGLDAKPYPHLAGILSFLGSNGIEAEISRSAFEFQKGANSIMKLMRRRNVSLEKGRRGDQILRAENSRNT